MLRLRQKRQVPTPEVLGPHRSANPMFQTEEPADLKSFRRNVLMTFGLVVAVLLLGLAGYGPWWRITSVTIEGTVKLDPKSVERTTADFLDRPAWLVLPRRTLWLLSATSVEKYLQKKISTKLSIENVELTKQYPHAVTIVITERQPLARWLSHSRTGVIDRHGVIIEDAGPSAERLPIIHDLSEVPVGIDQPTVQEEIISTVARLYELLTEARLAIGEFQIPVPTCPSPVTNTNSALNTNTDGSTLKNNHANLDVQPASILPLDTANTNVEICDPELLRLGGPEIHVQLKDGPKLLFDRHQDLVAAVSTAQRVLQDPKNLQAKYIDLRFGERVYIQ